MNIIPIDNFDQPELDIYARLSEAQLLHLYEPNGGIFIAESPKVIERALDASYEPISVLMDETEIEKEANAILNRCSDLPIYTAAHDVLTKLTGFHLTRGMLCAMRRPPHKDLQSVCEGARRIAVLENVVNPTNVGAIIRSAAALNMDAVLLTPGCADPLYRRAIRVSMGTVFQIPFTYIGTSQEDWTNNGIHILHELGFSAAAMALCENTIPIDDPKLMQEEKLAIILGTEGEGLAQSTIASSDYTIKIPMAHGVDSLNVAAASAIAFFQLGKKCLP